MATLQGLPRDILRECIGGYLCGICITKLASTCKLLRKVFSPIPSKVSETKSIIAATYVPYGVKFMKACILGDECLIHHLIKNGGVDLDYGLYGACFGGHREIVDLMIKYGANSLHWNTGLVGACEGNHVELAELMINRGATNVDMCFREVARRNHKLMVDFLINCGTTFDLTTFVDAANEAQAKGYLYMAEYIRSRAFAK